MGFSRQEYWSGLPFPPPGDLPDPGIEPPFLISHALAGGLFITSATWKPSETTELSTKAGSCSGPSWLQKQTYTQACQLCKRLQGHMCVGAWPLLHGGPAWPVLTYQELPYSCSFRDKGILVQWLFPHQRNRMVSSETVPCINGFLHHLSLHPPTPFHCYCVVYGRTQGRMLSNKWCWTTEPYGKIKLCQQFTPHTKVSSEWVRKLRVKGKTQKTPQMIMWFL